MSESNKNAGHANESFRFVQLSDLHLSSIGVPNPLYLMNKRALGYLSWLKKRRFTHQRWILDCALSDIKQLNVDHYAITGDLTHIGLKHEFTQVASWLSDVGEPENVTIIPGNHDLYVNEHWNRSFLFWQDYMLGDNMTAKAIKENNDALNNLNALYPIVRIRKHVAFIALSSVFNAPWFRATGKISDAQLNRLKTLLSNGQLDDYCKVLLIHHPITLSNTPARKSLLNHSMLTAILNEHPVQVILHGHGHHSNMDTLICNKDIHTPVIGMSSTSSTSQSEKYKAEFLLFDIHKTHSHWNMQLQHHTLNLQKNSFIHSHTENFSSPLTI